MSKEFDIHFASMTHQETDRIIKEKQEQIAILLKDINAIRQSRELEPFLDYELKDSEGNSVLLSSLFGDRSELLVIHNMGKGCSYCTLWADGFNGLTKPLNDRVPFVLISPDVPSVMKEFASSREWKFKCISAFESDFTKDAGFSIHKDGKEYFYPGVSAFVKKDGQLFRANKDYFGPGDMYCSVWHFFDLLPKPEKAWHPKFIY